MNTDGMDNVDSPGEPVRRIVLENIKLTFDGGFDEEIAAEIPENSAEYPGGRMFGKMAVFGLFVRHAEDIALRGVRLRTALPDPRSAFRFEDVKDLRVTDSPGAEVPAAP